MARHNAPVVPLTQRLASSFQSRFPEHYQHTTPEPQRPPSPATSRKESAPPMVTTISTRKLVLALFGCLIGIILGVVNPFTAIARADTPPNFPALAQCESSGNPQAINPAGYYGLYQFDIPTWNANGGSKYAARADQATAEQQTIVAQALYTSRGAQPWPTCGHHLNDAVTSPAATPVAPVAPPAPAAPAPAVQTASASAALYTVKSGDMVSTIAANEHNGDTTNELCGRNQDVIKDPTCHWIYPDQQLKLKSQANPAPQPAAPVPAPVATPAPAPAAPSVSASGYMNPLGSHGYSCSSGYGPRTGGFHHGQDMATPIGTPVYAPTDMVIERAGAATGYGQAVMGRNPATGMHFVFGHVSKVLVSTGQSVHAGQLIALSGNEGQSSGPHLHFEIDYDPWTNSVNPDVYMASKGVHIC